MNQTEAPWLSKYLDEKEKSPEVLVFYRMGGFYELFFGDARRACKLLDLTLTCRRDSAGEPVPMAGVPAHSLAARLGTLAALGVSAVVVES